MINWQWQSSCEDVAFSIKFKPNYPFVWFNFWSESFFQKIFFLFGLKISSKWFSDCVQTAIYLCVLNFLSFAELSDPWRPLLVYLCLTRSSLYVRLSKSYFFRLKRLTGFGDEHPHVASWLGWFGSQLVARFLLVQSGPKNQWIGIITPCIGVITPVSYSIYKANLCHYLWTSGWWFIGRIIIL